MAVAADAGERRLVATGFAVLAFARAGVASDAARFRMPPAPVVASVAPHAPTDLTGDAGYRVAEMTRPSTDASAPQKVAKQRTRRIAETRERTELCRQREMRARRRWCQRQSCPRRFQRCRFRGRRNGALKIEIDSTVGDGALAIFADQALLYTTELKVNTPGHR